MTTEKAIKNIDKKKKRGVESYNEYQFEFKGKTWNIKLEVLRGGTEQFYSIKK